MNFTEEQEKKIFANLEAIEEYIKNEIQPKIPEYEVISAEFCSISGNYKCKLNVYDHGINGYIGYAFVRFTNDESSDSVYSSVSNALEFIMNWNDANKNVCILDYFDSERNKNSKYFKSIKEQLHENLGKILKDNANIVNVIENFEV